MTRNYRLKQPRRTTTIRCECYAAPVLFRTWDKMTSAAQDEFLVNGSIPCEGGGVPGEWCDGCRFGKVLAPEDE